MKKCPKNNLNGVHIGGFRYVKAEDVIHLQADVNYTNIFLNSGEKVYVATTIKKVFDALMPFGNFIRIHRGSAINASYVTQIEGNTICLETGENILASRRQKKELKKIKTIISLKKPNAVAF